MKCTKCQNEMKVIKNDESVNSENGKKYKRVIYHREPDDIWINLEVPQEIDQ